MTHPKCFETDKQFDDYTSLAAQSRQENEVGCCVDCNPQYQLEKWQEGCCEHPEVVFYWHKLQSGGYSELQGALLKEGRLAPPWVALDEYKKHGYYKMGG